MANKNYLVNLYKINNMKYKNISKEKNGSWRVRKMKDGIRFTKNVRLLREAKQYLKNI